MGSGLKVWFAARACDWLLGWNLILYSPIGAWFRIVLVVHTKGDSDRRGIAMFPLLRTLVGIRCVHSSWWSGSTVPWCCLWLSLWPTLLGNSCCFFLPQHVVWILYLFLSWVMGSGSLFVDLSMDKMLCLDTPKSGGCLQGESWSRFWWV